MNENSVLIENMNHQNNSDPDYVMKSNIFSTEGLYVLIEENIISQCWNPETCFITYGLMCDINEFTSTKVETSHCICLLSPSLRGNRWLNDENLRRKITRKK